METVKKQYEFVQFLKYKLYMFLTVSCLMYVNYLILDAVETHSPYSFLQGSVTVYLLTVMNDCLNFFIPKKMNN